MNQGPVRTKLVFQFWLAALGVLGLLGGVAMLGALPRLAYGGTAFKAGLAGVALLAMGILMIALAPSRGCGACRSPLHRRVLSCRGERWQDVAAAFEDGARSGIADLLGKGPVAADVWSCFECGACARVQIGIWEPGQGKFIPQSGFIEVDGELAEALRVQGLMTQPLTAQ